MIYAIFFGTSKKFWQQDLNLEELEKFEFEGDTFYYEKDDLQLMDPKGINIILLGKFDPLLLAYARKDILVPKEFHKTVWGGGGQISPILFVNESFAGKWRFAVSANLIKFDISILELHMTEEIKTKIETMLENFSSWMLKRKTSFNWSLLEL